MLFLALVSLSSAASLRSAPRDLQKGNGKAKVNFGMLYYEGEPIRTVVTPKPLPKEGVDPLYLVPNQMPVIAYAPGDTEYSGGRWAVFDVEWTTDNTFLITDFDTLDQAVTDGLLVTTRNPSKDFLCPVQP